jgi:hypothetical protein
MHFRLNKAMFLVRCRHPHCLFNERFGIEENIAGITETDVKSEAYKLALSQAQVKHNSLYGRKHDMVNPEIRMVQGSCVAVGFVPEHVGSRA